MISQMLRAVCIVWKSTFFYINWLIKVLLLIITRLMPKRKIHRSNFLYYLSEKKKYCESCIKEFHFGFKDENTFCKQMLVLWWESLCCICNSLYSTWQLCIKIILRLWRFNIYIYIQFFVFMLWTIIIIIVFLESVSRTFIEELVSLKGDWSQSFSYLRKDSFNNL